MKKTVKKEVKKVAKKEGKKEGKKEVKKEAKKEAKKGAKRIEYLKGVAPFKLNEGKGSSTLDKKLEKKSGKKSDVDAQNKQFSVKSCHLFMEGTEFRNFLKMEFRTGKVIF